MMIVGTSLKLTIKGVEIDTHKDQFGMMFELPFLGVPYAYERPIKFKKFECSIYIYSLFVNPMEDMKLSIKVSFLKPKVYVIHYLLTRILLPRNINLKIVIRNDIFSPWLLTKQFQIWL